MKNRCTSITIAALVLVVLPFVAVAQSPDALDTQTLQKIRERELTRRANIVRLESSPESFIGEIVNKWAATARERGYNLEAWKQDMTTALSPLTQEKLLSVHGAESYDGFVSQLTGRRASGSAGSAGIVPMVLGDEDIDLVYTPVEPCRILNTFTGTGAFGTPLAPATPRNYAHNQNLAAQGGNAAGCGIPTDPAAIAVTLTVVAPAGPGNLRAWPLLSPVPNASVINYTNVVGLNLANTHILPTCQVCGNDFTVQADVSATHFIADVVGYFWSPSAFPTAGHAFAVVENNATFDAARTKGFSAVNRPATGVYCLTPSPASTSPTNRAYIVSVDWGKSVSGQDGLVEARALSLGCAAGQFEVRTFLATTGAATNNLGFHIFVP